MGILPSSVINAYPKENQKLADEIVVNKGCLLSEYLPNERIQKHYFIQRNRLQAALSDKVIVLQTGIKGGTINTVNFALKYGKKVFCLSPEDYPSVDMDGNKMLLDRGKGKFLTDATVLNR